MACCLRDLKHVFQAKVWRRNLYRKLCNLPIDICTVGCIQSLHCYDQSHLFGFLPRRVQSVINKYRHWILFIIFSIILNIFHYTSWQLDTREYSQNMNFGVQINSNQYLDVLYYRVSILQFYTLTQIIVSMESLSNYIISAK